MRLGSSAPTRRAHLDTHSHDVYFFEDVPLVKRIFGDPNKDSLGELLVAFFNYYAREFRYPFDVVSLQSEAGVVGKDEKGWYRDVSEVAAAYFVFLSDMFTERSSHGDVRRLARPQ